MIFDPVYWNLYNLDVNKKYNQVDLIQLWLYSSKSIILKKKERFKNGLALMNPFSFKMNRFIIVLFTHLYGHSESGDAIRPRLSMNYTLY